MDYFLVIPAKAGIHLYFIPWNPDYAGVTEGNPVVRPQGIIKLIIKKQHFNIMQHPSMH